MDLTRHLKWILYPLEWIKTCIGKRMLHPLKWVQESIRPVIVEWILHPLKWITPGIGATIEEALICILQGLLNGS